MTRCWPILAASLLCTAPPLSAQAPRRQTPAAPAAPGGLGAIRGVVFDSLLGAPLEGAHVWINGTSFSTMTDAGGRFRLDSVPSGDRLIAFEHPDLDSLGLSNNARRVRVTPGRPTIVELTIPSLMAMHRAACGPQPPAERGATRDSGIVYGTVYDTERDTRLGGARVLVAWTTARRGNDGRVEVGRPVVEIRSDSLGNYYACGVPTEIVITAAAQAGRFASGLTELLLGRRGVARRDISISRDSQAFRVDTTTNLRNGNATIIGTVLDENGLPRPSARAAVDDAPDEAYADEQGQFVLRNLPAGSQTLMVRMIGFTAVRLPVLLRNNDTLRIRVSMRGLTVLDTLRVTARSRNSQNAMEQLELRMRAGLGYFLRSEDVKSRTSMRSVVSGLPSLTIEGRSVYEFRLYSMVSGSQCPVLLYVDGLRTTTEAIQSYRPDQLVAVEWYPRGSMAPLQYQPASASACGVMLIWTRFM